MRLYTVHRRTTQHGIAKKLALFGSLVVVCLLLPLLSACSTSQNTSYNTSNNGNDQKGQSPANAPGSGSGTSSTPTPASGGVVTLNTTILYSSVTITIVDAKQAKSFPDDTSTSTSDVLRLDVKENNTSPKDAYYDFTTVARLLLPDGSKVAPLKTQLPDVSIAPSISRSNWIDFPAPLSDKLEQLTLQLGKDSEAQELIPLTAGADVAKYLPKSSSPNASMKYGGITWTVTKATSELGYAGKQAGKGMMFVVVDLNADNNGTKSGGGDLVQVRLKSGAITTPAQEFLNDVAASQTGVKSTLSFPMPQGDTSFTLIFLPSNAYGITTQSTVDFQIA